jgi:hypothetical protein
LSGRQEPYSGRLHTTPNGGEDSTDSGVGCRGQKELADESDSSADEKGSLTVFRWPGIARSRCPRIDLQLVPSGKGAAPGNALKQLNNFGVPGHLADLFCQLLGHYRLDFVANQFFVLAVKLGISENLAHGLFENLHAILWRSAKRYVRRTDKSEGAPCGKEPYLSRRFGKALDLGQMRKTADVSLS